MNSNQVFRLALRGILAATTLTLVTFSALTIADELRFKLTGDKEVPPVTTKASGDATLTINKDMTISGKVMTSGISGNAAHIHLAKTGVNGPVIVPLVKNGDNGWMVPDGSKLTEDQYKAYMAGELYVNVHSAENKGGEIRGQLMPSK